MTVSILTRYDAQNNIPVVFITDNIDYEAKTIQAWKGGRKQKVSLDYYHTTVPLSSADTKALRDQFVAATNTPEVMVRDRLPRQQRVRPNLISGGPSLVPATQQPALTQAGKPRQRNKRPVENRIVTGATANAVPAAVTIPASAMLTHEGFTFDVAASLAAIQKETENKIAAVMRAAGIESLEQQPKQTA